MAGLPAISTNSAQFVSQSKLSARANARALSFPSSSSTTRSLRFPIHQCSLSHLLLALSLNVSTFSIPRFLFQSFSPSFVLPFFTPSSLPSSPAFFFSFFLTSLLASFLPSFLPCSRDVSWSLAALRCWVEQESTGPPPRTRTVGVQSMFRESEAQTDPYAPQPAPRAPGDRRGRKREGWG